MEENIKKSKRKTSKTRMTLVLSTVFKGKGDIRGEMLGKIIKTFIKYRFFPQSVDIKKKDDETTIIYYLERL